MLPCMLPCMLPRVLLSLCLRATPLLQWGCIVNIVEKMDNPAQQHHNHSWVVERAVEQHVRHLLADERPILPFEASVARDP